MKHSECDEAQESIKRQHYYSFTFSYSDGNKITTASAYVGYDYKFISVPQIAGAKDAAKINKDAVMLACCYLGKMTKTEMQTGIINCFTLTKKVVAFWDKLKSIIGNLWNMMLK